MPSAFQLMPSLEGDEMAFVQELIKDMDETLNYKVSTTPELAYETYKYLYYNNICKYDDNSISTIKINNLWIEGD